MLQITNIKKNGKKIVSGELKKILIEFFENNNIEAKIVWL